METYNNGIEVKALADDWLVFARAAGVHPKVLAFIEANPGDLFPDDESTNPRKWVIVSNFLVSCFFEGVGGAVDTYYNALLGKERYARFKAFTYDQ
jgi:hypothetical protein